MFVLARFNDFISVVEDMFPLVCFSKVKKSLYNTVLLFPELTSETKKQFESRIDYSMDYTEMPIALLKLLAVREFKLFIKEVLEMYPSVHMLEEWNAFYSIIINIDSDGAYDSGYTEDFEHTEPDDEFDGGDDVMLSHYDYTKKLIDKLGGYDEFELYKLIPYAELHKQQHGKEYIEWAKKHKKFVSGLQAEYSNLFSDLALHDA